MFRSVVFLAAAMIATQPALADCKAGLKALNAQFKGARQEVGAAREELLSLKQELDELGVKRTKLVSWYETNWPLGEDGKNRPGQEMVASFLDESIAWTDVMKESQQAHLVPLEAQLPLHSRISAVGKRTAEAADALSDKCPSKEADRIAALGAEERDERAAIS